MTGTPFHILIYDWLQPLLQRLRDKGLPISPDTHLQVLKMLEYCGPKIHDGESLFHYLSPILAKSAEQVKLLEAEVKNFLDEQFPARLPIRPTPPPPRPNYNIWKWAAFAAPVLALILFFVLLNRPGTLNISANTVQGADFRSPVYFDALPSLSKKSDTQNVRFTWNFGDGNTDSSGYKVQHTYGQPGRYTVSLRAQKTSGKLKMIRADTSWQLTLCRPPLQITTTATDIEIGQPVEFQLEFDSLYPPGQRNNWYVNDTLRYTNQYAIHHTFHSAGLYQVQVSSDDTAMADCGAKASLAVRVQSPQSLMLTLAADEDLGQPDSHVRSSWLWIFGLLAIIPGAVALYIKRRLAKKDRASKKRVNNLVEQFSGRGAPWEIPFKNHDELIEVEKEFSQVSRLYKSRSQAETYFLNIPQTISSTIRSEGLLQPEFTSASKPLEFLILIDKTKVKSQQVKLFEYLVSKFSRNDIYLEKFYFQSTPEICSNAHYPNGIHISRLHEQYAGHTLIIFGNGYQFLDPHYPALKDPLIRFYKKWTHRAICTPVSYADWNYRENVLQQAGAVFPADLKGQLLLLRVLEQSELWQDDLKKYIDDAYSVKKFNFTGTQQLREYLGNAFMYQWLCALAVYPHIDWNVTVAIGDALQAKHFKSNAVNYTSLLKLVRIDWMVEGTWPGNLRLELLKDLEPAHEKTARETMVRLLEEVLPKVKASSAMYENVQTQLIVNKFLLHAHSPLNPQYSNYEQAVDQFRNLWEQEKITDVALGNYLQKPGGAAGWSTLIGNDKLSDAPAQSETINAYLKDGINVVKKQWAPAQKSLLVTSAISASLLTVLLITGSSFRNTAVDKWLRLTESDNLVNVLISLAFNDCFDSTRMRSDAAGFILQLPDGRPLTFNADTPSRLVRIPYHWKDSVVHLSVNSLNPEYNRDTSFKIASNRVRLGISGCPPVVPTCNRWTAYSQGIENFQNTYSGDWYDIPDQPGAQRYEPFHIEPGYINGKKMVEMYSCPNDSSNLKVILDNENGTFQVAYLRLSQLPDNLSFAFINDPFPSRSAARADASTPPIISRQRIGRSTRAVSLMTGIAQLQGRWQTGDAPAQDERGGFIITANNGQPTVTINNVSMNVLRVETSQENDQASFYKITMRAPDGRTGSIHFLQLSDSRMLLSEEIHPPRTGITRASSSIGIFYPVVRADKGREFTQLDPASLPASLYEIWQGGSSNRYVNFDRRTRYIYYALGNPNDYTEFPVSAAYSRGNEVYKLVSNTRAGTRVLFIRNITAQSYQFSLCENDYRTTAEVEALDESFCNQFNTLRLYYEKNGTRIFVPVNGINYVPDETRKMNNLLSPQGLLAEGRFVVDSIQVFINSNGRDRNEISNRFTQIKSNCPLSKLKANWYSSTFEGNKFDRDYILVKTKNTDLEPNCQTTYRSLDETRKLNSPLLVCRLDLSSMRLSELPKELYAFTNLQYLNLGETTISDYAIEEFRKRFAKLDLQYTRPLRETNLGNLELQGNKLTNEDTKLLKDIASFLAANPNASIRIEAVVYNSNDRALAQKIIDVVKRQVQGYNSYIQNSQVTDRIIDRSKEQSKASASIRIIGINFETGSKLSKPPKAN